jgi:flagellar motility protein MotE (MotC chaperone)
MIDRSRMTALVFMMIGGGTGLALVTSKAISNEKPKAAEKAGETAQAAAGKSDEAESADSKVAQNSEGKSSAGPEASQAKAKAPKAPATGCIVDEQAVSDLKHRWLEVDQRSQELQARESELKAKERAVDEEYKKIIAAKEELEILRGSFKKENEEKIAKIVETLESMSPKASAQLLSTLDEPLAVRAIQRLSTQKLAKVLAGMEPARAARLTEVMAGIDKVRKPAQKGGEAHDGFNPIPAQPSQPAKPNSSAFIDADEQVANLGT